MKISVKQNWFINSFIEIKFETLELYIWKLIQLLQFYHSFPELIIDLRTLVSETQQSDIIPMYEKFIVLYRRQRHIFTVM